MSQLCHTFLLVNVDFFSIKPRPSSPSFQMGRRASLETSLVTSSRRPSFSLSSSEFAERLNTRANGQPINMDALPLIDLSSHSSEAGDTPPLPEATIPAALSPTQLQLRSLSPAFDASMQGSKNEAPEPLEQPSTQSTTLPALSHGASLLKRKETVPLMVDAYGLSLPNEVARSMSTISYPDVGDNVSTSDDSSDIGGIMGAHISEEGSTAVQYSGRTDIDDDEDYEDDETENPLPDTEINEIALTDSPRYAPATLPSGPEPIDVLDPESRKASMDVSSLPTVEEEKLESPSPIAMPMPNAPIAPEVAQSSCTPPPSHVFTPPVASNSAESNLVESPRDVFSPTPVSFPQPVNHLSFFREQIHQRLQSDSGNPGAPENTSSSAEGPVKKDDGLVEPTPYPSPPFTPPSSRPPTVYSSMAPALQMPSIDANVNPVVSEKGQLSALVEEVKADLDAEKKTFVPEEPTQAPDQDVNEDESPAPKEEPTKNHFPEPITHASPSMPEPPAMLEPLPIAETLTNSPDSSEIKMPTPPSNLLFQRAIAGISLPRVASPVTSIGKGGISNGSRINVDDMGRYAHSSWDVTKEEKTLMNGTAEERLNEVDNNAVDEDTSPTRPRSPGSGADDESAAPRSMTDMRKKKKKKSRSSKAKKEVSFDEASFIIGSEQEKEPGDKTGNANVELKTATASDASLPSSSISNLIPIPRSFEIEDDDSSEAPPLRPSMDVSNGSIRGSPIPSRMSVLAESRRNSIFSEIMSPRSTADELSDSSSAFPLALGEFSARQVDSYARWFARVHRDKSVRFLETTVLSDS